MSAVGSPLRARGPRVLGRDLLPSACIHRELDGKWISPDLNQHSHGECRRFKPQLHPLLWPVNPICWRSVSSVRDTLGRLGMPG